MSRYRYSAVDVTRFKQQPETPHVNKLFHQRTIVLAVGLGIASVSSSLHATEVDGEVAARAVAASSSESDVVALDLESATRFVSIDGADDGSEDSAVAGVHGVAIGAASYSGAANASAFGYGSSALGVDSTALGALSLTLGQGSSALGFAANALGDYSGAFGYGASASGYASLAMGYQVTSSGAGSIAIGGEATLSVGWGEGDAVFTTRADGALSTALGPGAQSDGNVSVAVGAGAQSYGELSVAMGHRSEAGERAVAVGNRSEASGYLSAALGSEATAVADGSLAVGGASISKGTWSAAVGTGAFANGDQSTAVGANSMAWGYLSTALGNGALAESAETIAMGYQAHTWGQGSLAIGTLAQTGGDRPMQELPPPTCPNPDDPNCGVIGWEARAVEQPLYAIAIGQGSQSFGTGSVALGHNALTLEANSVALGDGSLADRADTISVGSARSWMRSDGSTVGAFTRQITNVAAGTESNDAVNVGQLAEVATALGGGSKIANGVFTAPVYRVQGVDFQSVGSAIAAVDTRLTSLQSQLDSLPPPPPPAPPVSPPVANPGGIAYDDDTKGSVTLEGQAGTVVKNVGEGIAATDAVNKAQMERGDAATLSASRGYTDSETARVRTAATAYTDATATRTLSSANAYTDRRFEQLTDRFDAFTEGVEGRLANQDERIDRMGAMSSAMMSMAMNAAGPRTAAGRLGVGAGWQGGQTALSVGYTRALGTRATFSLSGAFTDDESSAGVGFGIDL